MLGWVNKSTSAQMVSSSILYHSCYSTRSKDRWPRSYNISKERSPSQTPRDLKVKKQSYRHNYKACWNKTDQNSRYENSNCKQHRCSTSRSLSSWAWFLFQNTSSNVVAPHRHLLSSTNLGNRAPCPIDSFELHSNPFLLDLLQWSCLSKESTQMRMISIADQSTVIPSQQSSFFGLYDFSPQHFSFAGFPRTILPIKLNCVWDVGRYRLVAIKTNLDNKVRCATNRLCHYNRSSQTGWKASFHSIEYLSFLL